MKILLGLEATTGGALKHVTYLSSCMSRKSRYDITVVLSPERANADELSSSVREMTDAGVKLHYIGMSRNISVLRDIKALYQLFRLISAGKYDVIHAHNSKAGALMRLAAWVVGTRRILYTPHCFYFQSKKNVFARLFFYFIEAALSIITDYIIVADNEREEARRLNLIPARKLLTINNAVKFEMPKYSRQSELKKQLGFTTADFLIAAIGRLEEQKDFETFLKAARVVVKNNRQCRFLIVGEGPLKSDLEQLICEFNLNEHVILTGFVANIHEIYQAIDVLVSTSRWEGLPYVLLEGMQFRKPIIATSLYTPDMIKHEETGFVCHCGDHEAIANQIMRLIDDRPLLERLGNQAFEHALRRFQFDTFINRHESLYANDAEKLRVSGESSFFPG